MSVTAKCHNYTGCLLAYRGEEIQLASGAPMVCPECGKAVTVVQGSGAKFWRVVPWLILLLALAAGTAYVIPILKKKMADSPAATPSATPAVAPAATPAPIVAPARPKTGATATPAAEPQVSTPAVAPAKIELNPNRNETRQVRDEVLKRIDSIPGLTAANKDKLYNSVQRARAMGLVLTLPFPSGRTALAPGDVQELKSALESPQVRQLRDDPVAVFVVLGYADPKGDSGENLKVSQRRAEAVVAAMHDKCGIGSVIHPVGMGGSTLLDAQNLEKNRIVEVWAVLP